jgi:pimeloyl-ACP methyl ester carboxylesterase
MPSLKRPDVDLYYEISGTGPPLVLIPGMLSDSATWLPVIALLQPHFTLIRPDNRATGRMQNGGPFTLEDCADDIAALIEHLDLHGVHVAGHSMGGYLTLMLAERIPDRLASLSLLTSALINGPRNSLLFAQTLTLRTNPEPSDGFWLRTLFPWLMSPDFFANPAQLDAAIAAALMYPYAQSSAAMAQQIQALTGFTHQLDHSLPCPVQAIIGDNDLLFPEPDARHALNQIPNIEIHTIKGAAHSIHWEQPLALCNQIIAFTKH